MSEHKKPLVGQFEPVHPSMASYVLGFVACIMLTLAAYFVTVTDSIDNKVAIGVVAALALVQCMVQLVGFLHLGREFKPRWKLNVFLLMLTITLIVVIGSLWIMSNLDYRMIHSPDKIQEYVESQEGF